MLGLGVGLVSGVGVGLGSAVLVLARYGKLTTSSSVGSTQLTKAISSSSSPAACSVDSSAML